MVGHFAGGPLRQLGNAISKIEPRLFRVREGGTRLMGGVGRYLVSQSFRGMTPRKDPIFSLLTHAFRSS